MKNLKIHNKREFTKSHALNKNSFLNTCFHTYIFSNPFGEGQKTKTMMLKHLIHEYIHRFKNPILKHDFSMPMRI